MQFIPVHFSRPGCFTGKLELIKEGVHKNGIPIGNNGIGGGWSNGAASQ
jgi:hypothetical protein